MVEMKFEDIFDVDEMEKLMDSLSKSFEVGMGIRTPEGGPAYKRYSFL